MKDITLLRPVLAQVLLTFVIMFYMAKVRFEAISAGTVQRGAPGQRPTWPEQAAKVSNAYHNLLEMPVLFYAVVAFALITSTVDWQMYALAWAYVACRVVQAAIHVSYNTIPHRAIAFLASNLVLVLMWVKVAITVFSSGPL